MCEKCPNMEFFFGPYIHVFSPNAGKYGPEKTPCLYSLTLGLVIHITFTNVFQCDKIFFIFKKNS